MVSYD